MSRVAQGRILIYLHRNSLHLLLLQTELTGEEDLAVLEEETKARRTSVTMAINLAEEEQRRRMAEESEVKGMTKSEQQRRIYQSYLLYSITNFNFYYLSCCEGGGMNAERRSSIKVAIQLATEEQNRRISEMKAVSSGKIYIR